jgi:hypothetical protein
MDRIVEAVKTAGLRALAVALAAGALVGGTPTPAQADASQLCRAASNMVLAPADVALSPFIAAKDEYYGLREIGDPIGLKIVGAGPGYLLLLGLQAGGTIFREISALIELPMGMVTLFREGAQPPLFRSQQDAWALYSEDYGVCPVHFGVSYNTINDG